MGYKKLISPEFRVTVGDYEVTDGIEVLKQRVSHGLVPGGIITTASGSPEVQRYG